MPDRTSDEDLARLVGELVTALQDLERELESSGTRDRPPLPTPRDLRRFTSEVAIPGFILLLETNVRALRLLQRALELGDRADRAGSGMGDLRDRATAASETTLGRLDDALAELGRAIEGRPNNDEAAELLEQARELRAEVHSRLEDRSDGQTGDDGTVSGGRRASSREDAVSIDVDAELQSIKDELDETDRPDEGDGTDDPAEEPTDDDGDAGADRSGN